jgi:ribosomal protein L19
MLKKTENKYRGSILKLTFFDKSEKGSRKNTIEGIFLYDTKSSFTILRKLKGILFEETFLKNSPLIKSLNFILKK